MLTFEEAAKLSFEEMAEYFHKELWGWLAENGAEHKYTWSRWERNGGDIPEVESFCFACETTTLRANEKEARGEEHESDSCELCPITDSKARCCNGNYDEWCSCSKEERPQYARAIRDLPWVKK